MKKIILASQSARRKELLELVGFEFDVLSLDVDETLDNTKPLEEELKKLAYKKANAVFQNHPDSIVIGADTIVSLDNEVLGKPKDRDDAIRMLKSLSNRKHDVMSAFAIISKDYSESFISITEVEFYELDDKTIIDYVDTKEPMDKAGAYGIQGKGAILVKSINGDYYTVMGLPIAEVYRVLKEIDGK